MGQPGPISARSNFGDVDPARATLQDDGRDGSSGWDQVVLGTIPPWGPGGLAAKVDPSPVHWTNIITLNQWIREYGFENGIPVADTGADVRFCPSQCGWICSHDAIGGRSDSAGGRTTVKNASQVAFNLTQLWYRLQGCVCVIRSMSSESASVVRNKFKHVIDQNEGRKELQMSIPECSGPVLSSAVINSLYTAYDETRSPDVLKRLLTGIYSTVCGITLRITGDESVAQQIGDILFFRIQRALPGYKNPHAKVERPKASNSNKPWHPAHAQHMAWKRHEDAQPLKQYSPKHVKKDGTVTDAGFYGMLASMAKTETLKFYRDNNIPHVSKLALADADDMGVVVDAASEMGSES